MDMKKFTEKSQLAVAAAQDIAIGLGHQQVDTEHLAIALVRQEGGLVPRLLEKAGLSPRVYGDALHKEMAKKPSVSGPGVDASQISVTTRLHQLLIRSHEAATRMKDEFVSVEHIFCEMAGEPAGTVIGKLNKEFGITRDKMLEDISATNGTSPVSGIQGNSTP